MKTALYRLYDAEGELLYVGISLSAIQRLSDHMKGKLWAEDIARVDVAWYDSRTDALAAEAKAIRAEWPRHNVQHNKRTPVEEEWFGRVVDARSMPDQCHDFCLFLDPDDGTIYFPYFWIDGVASYECKNGHSWTCTWGHRQSGEAPENRRFPE